MNEEEKKAFEKKYLAQFGERLRAVRKSQGFDNYELYSYHIEFNRSQLNRYENEQSVQLGTLFRLLSKMKTTPAEFFSEGFDWTDFIPTDE